MRKFQHIDRMATTDTADARLSTIHQNSIKWVDYLTFDDSSCLLPRKVLNGSSLYIPGSCLSGISRVRTLTERADVAHQRLKYLSTSVGIFTYKTVLWLLLARSRTIDVSFSNTYLGSVWGTVRGLAAEWFKHLHGRAYLQALSGMLISAAFFGHHIYLLCQTDVTVEFVFVDSLKWSPQHQKVQSDTRLNECLTLFIFSELCIIKGDRNKAVQVTSIGRDGQLVMWDMVSLPTQIAGLTIS